MYKKLRLAYFSIIAIICFGLALTVGTCNTPYRITGTAGKIIKFITGSTIGDSSLDESGATGIVGSKSINSILVALVDGASIATNAGTSNLFSVTLAGNRTLANPTNLQTGGTYLWVITQDGTGSRTLAYGNSFTWPSGAACVLSTAAGAIDLVTAVYDGIKLRAVCSKAFS